MSRWPVYQRKARFYQILRSSGSPLGSSSGCWGSCSGVAIWLPSRLRTDATELAPSRNVRESAESLPDDDVLRSLSFDKRCFSCLSKDKNAFLQTVSRRVLTGCGALQLNSGHLRSFSGLVPRARAIVLSREGCVCDIKTSNPAYWICIGHQERTLLLRILTQGLVAAADAMHACIEQRAAPDSWVAWGFVGKVSNEQHLSKAVALTWFYIAMPCDFVSAS